MLRVLCVRFSSIGDILLTTPLVRALKRRHPDAELFFVTKQAMAPLIADNPHLAGVVTLAPGEPVGELAQRVRALAPTHGLDLHGSLRSAALRLRVRGVRWSGYSKRKLARTTLITTKIDLYGKHVPVAERYFEAARSLDVRPDGGPVDFFVSQKAKETVVRWLEMRGVTQPFAALAPGAAHATKRWPLAHWQELAARLAAAGYTLVAVGGPEDRALAAELGTGVVNAAGEFSLQETGACLARAKVLVSGDTGVMHMATGVGTPVVALFGPTVEAFGFFPYSPRAVVLARDMNCRPCSAMGTERCPLGHHRCMRDILPDEVAAALQRMVA